MSGVPETLGFSQFARLCGYKPSFVTQLKNDGRLVLTEDGKAVRVPESIARIRETRDPARQDVVERHAEARGAPALPGTAAGDDDPEEPTDDDGPLDAAIVSPYQQARAKKEHYLALKEQRDYEISMGKLMVAEDVASVVADTLTSLRTRLESLPDVVAAQLAAETNEAAIRAILADSIQHVLEEASRQFGRLAKEET